MGKNAAEGNRKKGKIAEEIRKRIGRSVLIAYIVVEVIIVIIMGQTVYYNKQAQLTLESESASNSLAGFFEKYERVTQTLALNPQIQSVLSETKAGDNILSAKAMGDVEKYLVDAAGAEQRECDGGVGCGSGCERHYAVGRIHFPGRLGHYRACMVFLH